MLYLSLSRVIGTYSSSKTFDGPVRALFSEVSLWDSNFPA